MGIVPGTAEAQAAFSICIFDEFARAGMRDVIVCPGSRSTPLALAAASSPRLAIHVRLDERSAGFFAIGRALATGRPVGIVVTSGTAAAELFAAVVEADLAGVPLIVVTADRPPELRGVGAAQTIDQVKLFGGAVRRFEELGPIRPGSEGTWRALASRLMLASASGPVHLNVPLVEPLLASASDVPAGRIGTAPWISVAGRGATLRVDLGVDSAAKVVVLAGRGAGAPQLLDEAAARGWVVLADPLGGIRRAHANVVAAFDPILRDPSAREALRPDVVLALGAMPASRVVADALGEWRCRVVAVAPAARVHDPYGVVTDVVVADPASVVLAGDPPREAMSPSAYVEAWRAVEAAVQARLDELLASELSEPAVARLMSRAVPGDVPLVVASSMPIRDLEWFGAKTPSPPLVLANRGANGIDGVVSTALGAAAGARAVGLLGDLCFLHDAGSLADGLGPASGSCVLVVVDNRGGGIFSFLPQRDALDPVVFERLFATPSTASVGSVAAGYGAHLVSAGALDEVRDAVRTGLETTGVTVVAVEVPDRDRNVAVHQRLNDAAASAARDALGG